MRNTSTYAVPMMRRRRYLVMRSVPTVMPTAMAMIQALSPRKMVKPNPLISISP